MAARNDRVCELGTARGPIQLLEAFNGGYRCQRRVSEEGSSLLKIKKSESLWLEQPFI